MQAIRIWQDNHKKSSFCCTPPPSYKTCPGAGDCFEEKLKKKYHEPCIKGLIGLEFHLAVGGAQQNEVFYLRLATSYPHIIDDDFFL